MLKICSVTLLTSLIFSFSVKAENAGKFYEDVLISEDIKLEQNAENAKNKASNLLDKKAPVIKIDGQPLPFRSERAKPTIVEQTTTKYGEGPFGLSWGGNYNQIKAMGVELSKTTVKDYPNSFIATQLPKPLPDIDKIIISFGEDNSLWRILGYGKLLDDTPDASKVLKLYRKYYKLLSQKYGNAQEFFTPKVTVTEKTVKDEYGRDKIEVTRTEGPIGGKIFLAELQSGEATLYATFEDNRVGAALAVNVDGNGKSYIIIDFTNLQIYRENEEQTLDAL